MIVTAPALVARLAPAGAAAAQQVQAGSADSGRAARAVSGSARCDGDSGIRGSSDAPTCFRSPSQPVVWNIPPGARRERTIMTGRSVEIICRLAVMDPLRYKRTRRPHQINPSAIADMVTCAMCYGLAADCVSPLAFSGEETRSCHYHEYDFTDQDC